MTPFEKKPPSPAEAIAGFEASNGMSIEILDQFISDLTSHAQQLRESLETDEVRHDDTRRALIEEEISLLERQKVQLGLMKEHFITMRADHERVVKKYRNSDPSLQ